MKKGRFLWSAYRITEKQKAGKARNIKEKQLKNSRSTDLKVHVELHNSLNVNQFIVSEISRSLFMGGLFLYKLKASKTDA